MNRTPYDEYYWKIMDKVIEIGRGHRFNDDDWSMILPWAGEHEPALRSEEAVLETKINSLWEKDSPEMKEFKQAVIAYGKVLMRIFDVFAAWKKKTADSLSKNVPAQAPAAPARQPHTFKPSEPAQGRLI